MERILDHAQRVTGPNGQAYAVRTLSAFRRGRWGGWLEFAPVDPTLPTLRTDRETTQSTRADVLRWAKGLNPMFIEGAFTRASRRSPRHLATRRVAELSATLPRRGGAPYTVRVFAEEEKAGTWLGAIEFEPVGGGPVLRASRETSQPSAVHVEYWATGLEPVFLEGALSRARAT